MNGTGRTVKGKVFSVEGTGFSPYINSAKYKRALAVKFQYVVDSSSRCFGRAPIYSLLKKLAEWSPVSGHDFSAC
jgi:hypothetical protein